MALFGKKKEDQAVAPKEAVVKAVKQETKKPTMKELYSEEVAAAKTEVKDIKGKKVVAQSGKYDQAYRILVKPMITEKGGDLASMSKYVFVVAKEANKVEIAKAIKEVYGIMPTKVNLMRMEGKYKQRGKTAGKRKDWKKAIITLPKGKTINVYEGV